MWGTKTRNYYILIFRSLREKTLPLLQNLLETDAQRQWSFATFLDESQRILGMRDFYVCDTECGEVFRLYMERKQRYVSRNINVEGRSSSSANTVSTPASVPVNTPNLLTVNSYC